mmetsp:Transcript_126832/g.364794  ORF Transcript_126832/g.364794 Transcript_126832/m.364794 type:complete len:200 (+) Transcript_126832:631-1230(+)
MLLAPFLNASSAKSNATMYHFDFSNAELAKSFCPPGWCGAGPDAHFHPCERSADASSTLDSSWYARTSRGCSASRTPPLRSKVGCKRTRDASSAHCSSLNSSIRLCKTPRRAKYVKVDECKWMPGLMRSKTDTKTLRSTTAPVSQNFWMSAEWSASATTMAPSLSSCSIRVRALMHSCTNFSRMSRADMKFKTERKFTS